MAKASKKTRIARYYVELIKIFGSLDENHLTTALGLIERAAFQRVELEDLELVIRDEGWTEEYGNGGGQFGIKKSTNGDVYLNLAKTYSGIMKHLLDLCPEAKSSAKLAEMLDRLE